MPSNVFFGGRPKFRFFGGPGRNLKRSCVTDSHRGTAPCRRVWCDISRPPDTGRGDSVEWHGSPMPDRRWRLGGRPVENKNWILRQVVPGTNANGKNQPVLSVETAGGVRVVAYEIVRLVERCKIYFLFQKTRITPEVTHCRFRRHQVSRVTGPATRVRSPDKTLLSWYVTIGVFSSICRASPYFARTLGCGSYFLFIIRSTVAALHDIPFDWQDLRGSAVRDSCAVLCARVLNQPRFPRARAELFGAHLPESSWCADSHCNFVCRGAQQLQR